MNSNILKENMKRFGTKNLSEQEVPAGGAAAPVDPNVKPEGKVVVKKTYSFLGAEYTDRAGRTVKNNPYSIELELISEPQVGADGKITGYSKKVMADGKIILALSGDGVVYQVFPGNYPAPMKPTAAGSSRVFKYLMGMLAMDGGMRYDRLKKGFAAKKLIKSFQGPTPNEIYMNKYPSKYYNYS